MRTITLEQVKADIKSGKSKKIYYSAHTLWWTHLWQDVNVATKQGKEKSQMLHELRMEDPSFPEEQKKKLNALWKMANSGSHQIPLDPSGSRFFKRIMSLNGLHRQKKNHSTLANMGCVHSWQLIIKIAEGSVQRNGTR